MMARGRLKLLPSLTLAAVGVLLLSLAVFTTPRVNAEETVLGARLADFDIDPLPGDGNKSARGVCSDGTTLWVVEERALKLYGYKLTDSGPSRKEAADIQLDVYENYGPGGCTSDGTTIWVADYELDKLFAYDIASLARVEGKDVDALGSAGNNRPAGVASTDSTIWVADLQDKKLYAYALEDGSRDSGKDISLHWQEMSPVGAWTDGATVWVADNAEGHFYAYALATGARDAAKEFPATDTTSVQGIWSDGSVLWAANRVDRSNAGNKVLAYRIAAPLSSDASLSALALSGVTLSPTFAAETTAYSASAAHEVAETTVTASATEADARVAVTPADADDQADGHQVDLVVGETVIEVEVTAADGETTQTYSVTVTRALSSDASLSGLALSGVTLAPAFAPETLEYTASVGNEVEETTVTTTATEAEARVAIIPTDADDQADGHQVDLVVGETVIAVEVTSADGETTQTYSVTVTRAKSSDASLSGLALSGVTLSPTFAAETTEYSASAGNEVAETTVTASATEAEARVAVTPADADDQAEGHQVDLVVGETVIAVEVTAADGETTQTYTVTITRTGSEDATLSNLELSGVTLSPTFATRTTVYSAAAAHEVAETTVTASATEAEAQVVFTPADADDQTDGHQVDLAVGETVIAVEVTAADGETRVTYSVTVTRTKSSDATLSGLALSGVTLSPPFAAETLEYTASLGNEVAETTVTAVVAGEGAAYVVEVDGAEDQDGVVPLAVGETVIAVEVTAADGETTQTYSVTVTRAVSSDASLSGLALSGVTLSPTFAAETTEYTASVGNEVAETTVTAVVAGEGAAHVIKVDGVADQDGTVPLAVGETIILVEVTSADGETTQTYQVKVTRASSNNATLSALELSGVMLAPSFTAETLEYTASVGTADAETTVTVSATEAEAQVAITPADADDQTEGHQVVLTVGETVIEVEVTAADGEATSTYSVTVTRAGSSDVTLSALTLKDDESTSVTLDPAFNSDHTSYAVSVGHGVETLTVAAEPSDAKANVGLLPPDADGERDGYQVALAVGVNVISIDVNAATGDSQRKYIVRVTRQAAPNALLKSLSISDANLSPPFDGAVFEYAVKLEHDVNVVTVEAAPADPNATAVVMVDGFVDGDGLIALPVGSSVIEVVATAKTGTHSKTYTIMVSRAVRKPAPLPTPMRSEDPPDPRPTPVRPTPTPTAVASGIGVSAAHIDLGVADTIDNKAHATLEVWNLGKGRVLLNFFDDAPWLSASPPFVVSTGPGDRQWVTLLADASFLGPGSHSAAFYVHADEVDSRTTVSVTLTVAPRPTPTPTPTPVAAPTAIPTPMPLPEPADLASPVPTATPTRPEASNSPMPLPPEPAPAPTATPVEVPTPVPSPIVAVLVGSEESATHVEQLVASSAETGLNPIGAAQQPTPIALAVEAPVTRTATVTLQYTSTGRDTGASKWVWTFFPGIILIDILASWRLRRKRHLD